jgi:hypothetical protein
MHGESADDEIVSLLRQRDGIATEVILRDGKCCLVYDIAWGYDDGDTFAHITTNISPGGQGRSVDFFFTNDIATIRDAASGNKIYGDQRL